MSPGDCDHAYVERGEVKCALRLTGLPCDCGLPMPKTRVRRVRPDSACVVCDRLMPGGGCPKHHRCHGCDIRRRLVLVKADMAARAAAR